VDIQTSLSSLLIMPVQRIPRYTLLLTVFHIISIEIIIYYLKNKGIIKKNKGRAS